MIHVYLIFLLNSAWDLALSIPPAARVLAVIGSVYGLLQLVKKAPGLAEYITGWVAIILNVLLTVCGLLITVPSNQLYTANTLVLILTTALGAAGVHGTQKAMSPPQVLAQTPPDPTVREVPATLVPKDPNAIPIEEKK